MIMELQMIKSHVEALITVISKRNAHYEYWEVENLIEYIEEQIERLRQDMKSRNNVVQLHKVRSKK